MRAKGWSPSLRAADATASDQFTIAIGELEYDEQFTAILSYDGRQPQPWMRIDVEREIADIAHIAGQDPIPVVLSNEGDVYTIADGRADWSKIPGAGMLSDDAAGLGTTNGLTVLGHTQFVTGAGRQLYCRSGTGAWDTLSADPTKPAGYQAESFGHAVALPDSNLLIPSHQRPGMPTGEFLADPRYRADMTAEEVVALMDLRAAEAAGGPPVTRLYEWSAAGFRQIDVPEDIHIRNLYLDPAGKVWITGVHGLILRGTPEDGFQRLGFHGDTQTLLSATSFRGEMILASDYALHRFDGHRLAPLKPRLNDPFLNRNTPTPLKLQTGGCDVLLRLQARRLPLGWRDLGLD